MLKGETGAQQWLEALDGSPVFYALYAADRSWMRTISWKTAQPFDYVLADTQTWIDRKNRPVRLRVAEEANAITNSQEFLDSLLDKLWHASTEIVWTFTRG